MSLVPETWQTIAAEDGAVVITRVKDEGIQRLTTWRLEPCMETRDGRKVPDWRIMAVFYSQTNEGLNRKPERLKDYGPKGIRLSDNQIDRTLRSMANETLV